GGELVDAADGARFESVDPGTGMPIATVAQAGPAEVDAAVGAARRAFDAGVGGGKKPVEPAGDPMGAAEAAPAAPACDAARAAIALVEALDSGGLVSRTAMDVFQAARFIRSTARYAARSFPWEERVPSRDPMLPGVSYLRREPVGVCVGIIPWNFPLLMA